MALSGARCLNRLLRTSTTQKFCSFSIRRYGSAVIRNILDLHERGVLQSIVPEGSAPDLARLLSSPRVVYCGFDPTADSLHIGNLLAIIALIHCQRAGHVPIAVLGGATARIGDPSGKSKDREYIKTKVLEDNTIGLWENLERIFTNHELHLWSDSRKLTPLQVLNNKVWYEHQNVVPFLSHVGRHFRLGPMLNKHSVRSRMDSPEGMCFSEFSYQVFQAYDWLHLHKQFDCLIQIGGHDQLGNITAGRELVDRVTGDRVFGLTIPLITAPGGEKLGKSTGNAVWLSPERSTPYDLYQYFINRPDHDVEKFLKLYTFIPDIELQQLMAKHKDKPDKRLAQKKLAEHVTLLVHGDEGLSEAKKWTQVIWQEETDLLRELSHDDLQRLFVNTPTIDLIMDIDVTVLDLVMKAGCFNREVDATRMISEGGIYVNYKRIIEPEYILIQGEDIMPNNITLLRVGKKNYHIIRWLVPQNQRMDFR